MRQVLRRSARYIDATAENPAPGEQGCVVSCLSTCVGSTRTQRGDTGETSKANFIAPGLEHELSDETTYGHDTITHSVRM